MKQDVPSPERPGGPRKRLPNRREAPAFTFTHDGLTYQGQVGFFEDGTIAEIFLNHRMTSASNGMAHDAATMFSIARQYGVPLDVLYDSLSKLPDGSPAYAFGVAIQCAVIVMVMS